MIQLSPKDASFLYLDPPEARQVFVTAYVFVPDGPSGRLPSPEQVTRWMADRVALDELRDRVVRVPFDLGLPYWVRDPDFALANHLSFHEGAGWEELRTLVADLVERPMDQSRPLWEFHLVNNVRGIPGTQGEATVAVIKFHHAMTDGVGSGQFTKAFFGVDPAGPTQAVVRGPAKPLPSRAGLVARAIWSSPRALVQFVGDVRTARAVTRSVLAERAGNAYKVPPATRPRTVFNQRLSPKRVYDVEFLPLSAFRAMKAKLGDVTVNDLVLTVVAGALRNYLAETGESVEESLAASVPMSIRAIAASDSKNKFVMMAVDLRTDVEDPIARLRAICQSVQDERTRMSNPLEIASYESSLLLPGWAIRILLQMRRARPKSDPDRAGSANIFVTSVPRRDIKLRLCDTVFAVSFGLSPLGCGGLAISSGAAGEFLTVNIAADPNMLRDRRRFAELIRISYEELRAAA